MKSCKVYPELKRKVHMEDIKSHVWVKGKDVLQTVPKVANKLKSVVQKAQLKFSLTEVEKHGKRRLIASKKYFASEISGICKDDGLNFKRLRKEMYRSVKYAAHFHVQVEKWKQKQNTRGSLCRRKEKAENTGKKSA